MCSNEQNEVSEWQVFSKRFLVRSRAARVFRKNLKKKANYSKIKLAGKWFRGIDRRVRRSKRYSKYCDKFASHSEVSSSAWKE